MEHAHCKDIKDMLDLVGVNLGELQTNEGMRQSSAYEVRHFSKKLYFRPGWHEKEVQSHQTVSQTVPSEDKEAAVSEDQTDEADALSKMQKQLETERQLKDQAVNKLAELMAAKVAVRATF